MSRRKAVLRAGLLADILERRQFLSGYTFSNVANFAPPLNNNPVAGLAVGTDQNLYGTSLYGGTYNDGTVFEVNASAGSFTTLVNFNSSGGFYPDAGLVLGADGNLYGTTELGGTSGDGTVFEINGSSHALTTTINFNSSTGAAPEAALIVGTDHNLHHWIGHKHRQRSAGTFDCRP